MSTNPKGENNSCYLDSILFAMFAFITEFDDLLKISFPISQESSKIFLLKERIKVDIVNELRLRGFVPSEHVVQVRNLRKNNK